MNIHIKSILAALAFSLLFYSKNFGLNVFLISLIVSTLIATNQKNKPVPWLFLAAFCFSGLMVFISPSILNLFAFMAAFLVLIGKSIANKSSTYISGLLGLISICMASVGNLLIGENKKFNKYNPKTILYVKGFVIALLLVIVFATLYRNSNPIFDDLITKIDFSFVNINWLLFTVLGYFIFFHLLRPFYSEDLIQQDANLPNDLPKPNAPFSILKAKKLSNEVTSGSIIFAALNLLLIFFLITDITYLTDSIVNSNIDYSKSVHQGVYALLFSIVCAIAIILYFFKGSLNFYQKNKSLLYLTYTWIGLNLILILTTCYKNFTYVSELGFTYKRIGVFVYLFLILVGLITTAAKVNQKKNFWYLFRSNTSVAFALLIVSTAIPWDVVITKYNLANIENPDISYLLELSTENSKLLYNYELQLPNASKSSYGSFINNRYSHYLEEQNSKSWQEYSIKNITLN